MTMTECGYQSDHGDIHMQVLQVCAASSTSKWPRTKCSPWRISRAACNYQLQPTVIPSRRYSSLSRPAPAPTPSRLSDPSRPDLFYHLVPPPTPISPSVPAFALSFLPDMPASAASAAVLGWLPAASEEGPEQEAGLNDFRENGMSTQFLLVVFPANSGSDFFQFWMRRFCVLIFFFSFSITRQRGFAMCCIRRYVPGCARA